MIKLENTEVLGWEHAIRGMRNPMNSWEKSDSGLCDVIGDNFGDIIKPESYRLGPNDHDLMMRLAKGGPVHAKYRRMIAVYVDITAPLYWWKEFDTYKVGTVANSCSTMHKIHAKEFTLEDFSCEHLLQSSPIQLELYSALACAPVCDGKPQWTPMMHLLSTIAALNHYRQKYHDAEDSDEAKKYWWQMIQLLPTSYNQKRTVMLNYEVLAGIYPMRKNHKLDEWHTFCDWIEGLPYSELITGKVENKELLSKPIEGLAPNTVRELVGMEPISHEDVSDSTPLFLKKSMTLDKEEKTEHLVDITCSWDVEELGGERIYAIGPGFTREDLTPYELYLLEKSEECEKRKKEK